MRAKAAPWILLVLASFFFWPNRDLADHAFADSPDYIYPSLHFLRGEGFVQVINSIKYPPVHPPGMALAMAPFYAIFGDHAGNGAYAVYLCSLLAVGLTYIIAKRFYGEWVAFVACLLLMIAPQFRFYSRQVSVDASVSAVFALAMFALALRARDSESILSCLLLGQLIGFSTIFRADNALFLVPVVALIYKRLKTPRLLAVFFASLLLWAAFHLVCNRLYTGDWFRSAMALYNSPQMDRVGGALNLRYFGKPSLLHSNFAFVLRTSVTQWSYEGPVKAVYVAYACLNLFLVVGLIKPRNEFSRYFLILLLGFTAFYSCLSATADTRYFQRLVPFTCILSGAGVTAVWRKLRRHVATPFTWNRVLGLKYAAFAGLLWAGLLLLPKDNPTEPYLSAVDRLSSTRYLQQVRTIVTEPDAVILTSFNLFQVDYYLGGPKRTLIPLHDHVDPLWCIQWKKPGHPEWINEDAPVPYRGLVYARSPINGGRRFCSNFTDHPQVVDEALELGRPVYYLCPDLYTSSDYRAARLLTQRYSYAPLESGFGPTGNPFLILRVYKRDTAEVQNNPGSVQLQAGKLEKAMGQYEQALRLKPDNAEAHYELGFMLNDQGKVPEAITHYEQALRLKPDFAEAHNDLADVLARTGKIEEAIAHYEQALRIKPDFAEAHNDLGNVLAQTGKIKEAIAHYEQALRIKPDFAEAHNNLGTVLAQTGKIKEAIAHYEQPLRIKADFTEAHNDLGNVLAQTGKIEEAIAHYEQALRIKPDYAEAHYNLGTVLAQTGKIKEAIAHFEQALRIKPDYVEAHFNLGLALEKMGRTPEAIGHYQQALRSKPDFAEAHNNLGTGFLQEGKVSDAIGYYEQALRINPDYAEAHYNLGTALARLGRLQEAMGHWEQALRINPDYAEAHSNLGAILQRMGRLPEAVAQYEQALRIKPDYVEAHFNLGLALEKMGCTPEAIGHYQQALRSKPDFTQAQNALARLQAGK